MMVRVVQTTVADRMCSVEIGAGSSSPRLRAVRNPELAYWGTQGTPKAPRYLGGTVRHVLLPVVCENADL